jgi:hypothetical protein
VKIYPQFLGENLSDKFSAEMELCQIGSYRRLLNLVLHNTSILLGERSICLSPRGSSYPVAVAKFPPGLGQVAGVSHLSKFIFIFGAKIS